MISKYISDSPEDKDDDEIITPTRTARQAVMVDESMGKRRICFASDPVVSVEQNGRLMRSPTPYPKELRVLAKYAKNIHKSNFNDYAHIDGIQVILLKIFVLSSTNPGIYSGD